MFYHANRRTPPRRFFFGLAVFATFTCLFTFLDVNAYAAKATLRWKYNLENSRLSGFKVFCGTEKGKYSSVIDVGKKTACSLSDLTPGTTYHFAVKAYGTDSDSEYSKEIAFTLPVTGSGGMLIGGTTAGASKGFKASNSTAKKPENTSSKAPSRDIGPGDSSAQRPNDPGDPDTPAPTEPDGQSPTLEVGEATVNHEWTRVEFKREFVDPVVVAASPSSNDPEPAVVRLRNVDATGFEIRLQEWEYLDGEHSAETICYMVMERGRYTLENGTQVEAGRFDTTMTGSFEPVNFSQGFTHTPVVMTAVSSFNGSNAVTGRMQAIGTEGFEYLLQEQLLNSEVHGAETISYIAWEPSLGSIGDTLYEVGQTENVVQDTPYPVPFYQGFTTDPVFIADMQTTNGTDPANVRCQIRNTDSAEVAVCEEQSQDGETYHDYEIVGYMVFGN